MKENPCSQGFLQDRSLCPVLHDVVRWPGYAKETKLQDAPSSTGTTDNLHSLGQHLFLFSFYHVDTNLPFSAFLFIVPALEHWDLCICLQEPDGRDIDLGWHFWIQP